MTEPASPPRKDATTLYAVAAVVVAAAAGWFLLTQLAGLFRPLCLAVFLAYIILPVHHRLRDRMSSFVAFLLIAVGTIVILYGLAVMVSASLVELTNDMPRMTNRAHELIDSARRFAVNTFPWMEGVIDQTSRAGDHGADMVQGASRGLLNVAALGLIEAFEVGFYLLFMLLEAGYVKRRVRDGFPPERAERVLTTIDAINVTMADYLRLKFWASLILAILCWALLWGFGVKFPLLWGVLTFFGNFIPYLGSIVSCFVPLILACLDMEFGWGLLALATLLSTIHLLMNYIVEPSITGKVINLSPMLILASLAFWGLAWGLIGMLLAVPLTVMFKVVLQNVEATRPFARLMAED